MKKVEIFTDGACKGNPGPGGWAALLRMGRHEKEIFGGEAHTTNNRMELTAVIKALGTLTEPCEVELYSDSTYVVEGLRFNMGGWWEVKLRLGGAGAVEQGFAALLGLKAGAGKRLVEVERGLAGLAGRNPAVAGGSPQLRLFGIGRIHRLGRLLERLCGLFGLAVGCRPDLPANERLGGDDVGTGRRLGCGERCGDGEDHRSVSSKLVTV